MIADVAVTIVSLGALYAAVRWIRAQYREDYPGR